MDNTFIKASSEYAYTYTEHLTKRKCDGKLLLARVGIVLLTLVLFSVIAFLTVGPVKVPQITVVLVVLVLILAKFLWGFTSIEYEYLIVSGTMSVDKIFDSRKRRQILEIKVSSAESILPLCDAKLEGKKIIFAASSVDDEDAYALIFKDEDKQDCALIFNATKKAVDMLKFYNKATVVSDKVK
ncbi:MAG: hypothetical protein E7582_04445 [Ruminococcaceae bacterium]|nr:hypothetical protein [Oscillospiraceae bacterium]